MKTILASIALAAAAFSVHATEESSWQLQVHTVSHHFQDRSNGKEWNEVNQGAGVRRNFNEDWSAQAGFYRNSINRWSTYAMAQWMPIHSGPWSAGAFAGVRTGYAKTVQPAAGVMVQWQGQHNNVTVRLTPKAGNTSSAAVMVEVGWKF